MLYERDFKKLEEKEKEESEKYKNRDHIKSINDEKRIWPRTPGRPIYEEFSKAVIHHHSIFPNNLLSVHDLKNKKIEFESGIETFETLINEKTIKEIDVLRYINENRNYFIVGSLFKDTQFGHHEAYLFREFPLGTKYRVDYLLIGKSSFGYHFVFVELESVNGRTTIESGDFGDAIRKGINQIKDWKIWLESNYPALKEIYNSEKNSDINLPKEFYEYDSSRISYVVVSGRREHFKEKTYRLKRDLIKENIKLYHYDNLLEFSKEIVSGGRY